MTNDKRTENMELWLQVFKQALTGSAAAALSAIDLVDAAIDIADQACERVSYYVHDDDGSPVRLVVE